MFQGKGQVPVADLHGHCAISHLKATFPNMKANRFIGSGDKHEMDRQAQQAQRALVNAAAAQAAGWGREVTGALHAPNESA